MKITLTLNQTRVLGALIEKEVTTPDQYPLSLNALMMACNQKSNRDPVLFLDEGSVQNSVDELMALRMIREESGYGSRVAKLKHRFCNTEFSDLKFSAQELAIIDVLFLRGAQTAGELRTRTNRLCDFANVGEVESALAALVAREDGPFVVKLAREPGKTGSRYAHLFSGEIEPIDESAMTSMTSTTRNPALPSAQSNSQALEKEQEQRFAALEQEIGDLKRELANIKRELGL